MQSLSLIDLLKSILMTMMLSKKNLKRQSLETNFSFALKNGQKKLINIQFCKKQIFIIQKHLKIQKRLIGSLLSKHNKKKFPLNEGFSSQQVTQNSNEKDKKESTQDLFQRKDYRKQLLKNLSLVHLLILIFSTPRLRNV